LQAFVCRKQILWKFGLFGGLLVCFMQIVWHFW
jgi:hypothetical protein